MGHFQGSSTLSGLLTLAVAYLPMASEDSAGGTVTQHPGLLSPVHSLSSTQNISGTETSFISVLGPCWILPPLQYLSPPAPQGQPACSPPPAPRHPLSSHSGGREEPSLPQEFSLHCLVPSPPSSLIKKLYTIPQSPAPVCIFCLSF